MALVLPDSAGGIGRHVRMLAEGLLTRGDRVTVVAPTATLRRFGFAELGVDSLTVDGPAALVAQATVLRRLARSHDVVHAHGVRMGAAAGLLGLHPLVVTWHNAPLGGPARLVAHTALERLCAARADIVLGASDDLVERARRAGARQPELCAVAAPPLSTVVGAGDRPAAAQPPMVLAVARLHRQKRLDLLVEATAGWSRRPGGVRVVVAGDGPLRRHLAELATSLDSPLELLGERDDVPALLTAASVVVLCSDWEARPLVAQEALHAGVPLIATAVGGVPGLVGDAAVLIPPGSPAALGQALERVLGDELLRARLRVAGPIQASTWPSPESMVSRIRGFYLDLT